MIARRFRHLLIAIVAAAWVLSSSTRADPIRVLMLTDGEPVHNESMWNDGHFTITEARGSLVGYDFSNFDVFYYVEDAPGACFSGREAEIHNAFAAGQLAFVAENFDNSSLSSIRTILGASLTPHSISATPMILSANGLTHPTFTGIGLHSSPPEAPSIDVAVMNGAFAQGEYYTGLPGDYTILATRAGNPAVVQGKVDGGIYYLTGYEPTEDAHSVGEPDAKYWVHNILHKLGEARPVPAPSSLVGLLGIGTMALVACGWRKCRRKGADVPFPAR